jgi:UDP-N-acetylmuramate dehydrogenase
MAVSDRHANFFVNKGQATRSDTLRLIETVRERVRGTTGVELELEVHLMNPEGA